ncbi:hypothetical protein LTR53_009548 [Teratosphaeriaceae sp. CCFEE 6253]|nr:hypothetical protein LTR53_009548 [Teratosphaeriaceae sp. CCFEE 6253]
MAQLANPSFTIEHWHTCLLCYGVLILAALVNIFGRFLLDKLGRIMITFNLLSFIVVMVVILVKDQHKQNAEFVFVTFQNTTGFGNSYTALLGILQAAFGMTCYDATAHMTEELHDARHTAPKAIIWSVWIGAVTGFAFLVAAMFCIGNLEEVVTTPTGVPLIAIFQNATCSVSGALGLTALITVIALVSLWFLMAQSSRVVFSLYGLAPVYRIPYRPACTDPCTSARDGGLPFSSIIARVHPTLHVPIYAILLVLVINIGLMSIYFGTVTGFNTVLAISTEAFYLSYIMPLIARIWQHVAGRHDIDSAYPLGRFGLPLNIIGLAYLLFAVITFNFPSVSPVTAETMNYTSAAVGVSVLIATLTWFTTGRRHYTGPQRGAVLHSHD